jgi:hypothetical protein
VSSKVQKMVIIKNLKNVRRLKIIRKNKNINDELDDVIEGIY